MTTRILLDHDIEGYVVFLNAGLQETGWDQYMTIEFLRLRDLGLSDGQSDRDIWRRVQKDRPLFITNNRNREGKTSLQATIENESRADSFPVLTISSVEKLVQADYRQQVYPGSLRFSSIWTATSGLAESIFHNSEALCNRAIQSLSRYEREEVVSSMTR